jgi:hypothetical protein
MEALFGRLRESVCTLEGAYKEKLSIMKKNLPSLEYQ